MSNPGEEQETARWRGAAVLAAIKRYRGVSDAVLALRLGLSRQMVQYYVTGKSRLEIGLMIGFAEALNVTPEVFFMAPDEALMWTITNRPNPPERGANAQPICIVPRVDFRRSEPEMALKLWHPTSEKVA